VSLDYLKEAVEIKGIPTVSVSVALDVSEHIKAPRAVFLPFMMGHPFGVPNHQKITAANNSFRP